MVVTSDFESGNGKKIKKMGKDHFSLETEGEGRSYASYFCLKVINEEEKVRKCQLDIRLDAAIEYSADDRRSFLNAHHPLWVSNAQNTWQKLMDYKEKVLSYQIDLRLKAKESLFISGFIPLFYTRMCEIMQEEYTKNRFVSLHQIGFSVQKRSLQLVSIGWCSSGKRVLVISGLHGIEFPGIWAARGIVEFLLSDNPGAKEIRDEFVVDVLLYGNPDGTVLGKPRTNAQGIDLHRQADPAKEPVAPEISAIWKWIEKNPPFLYINLHGWNASEKGKEPFEGSIRPAFSTYKKCQKEKEVAACDQSLITGANPISRYDNIAEFGATYENEQDNLCNLLARKYGTIAYVYEPNMRTGSLGCQAKGVKVLRALLAPFSY
jgi:hypothetical protein